VSWYDDVLPLARQASAATGLQVSAILAQWGHETGRGTSNLAGSNNLAGIKYTGNPGSRAGNGGAVYDSLSAFVADYIRVINLSFYDHVRAAAAQGPEAVFRAFTSSPPGMPRYAEDPAYSAGLLSIWRGDNLARYDGAGVVASQQGDTIQLAGVALPDLKPGVLGAIAAVAGAVLLLALSHD
jgi:flagellum-specific peptidoglycan hydrolase FlgJ